MKILYKIVIVMALIVLCSSCMSYAGYTIDEEKFPTKDDTQINGDINLPDLNNDGYMPKAKMGDTSIKKVSAFLGALTVLGVIVTVVSIAIIGFATIMGSASEKSLAQEKFIGVFIAGILLTSGSIIAKLIISVAESI